MKVKRPRILRKINVAINRKRNSKKENIRKEDVESKIITLQQEKDVMFVRNIPSNWQLQNKPGIKRVSANSKVHPLRRYGKRMTIQHY